MGETAKNGTTAEQKLAMQGDLINMMVHDLKGPLMEVISNIDLLSNSEHLDENEKEFAQTAMEGCTGLYDMVQDMLSIGRMESGMMKLEREPFNLCAVIKNELEKVRRHAEDNRVAVDLKCPADLTVNADQKLIARVAANLISNGLKYSPPGATLKISVSDGGAAAIVLVKDQGPGVPVEYRESIFEKYVQVELRTHRRQGSTGLGLPFCKMAVEAHGGKVGLNSPERGSEFYFVIPKNVQS
ncbi:MAG: HAMP domain-containing histidine kinase [Nitrospinae bacterium]|nr:HAMP domain-containing histidine kinase [Nitrospinota bacterium]